MLITIGDQVVRSFRPGDVEAVMGLMTEQAVFVNAEEQRLQGQEQLRAAGRARVDEGLVSQWQIYADNEPVRQLMANRQD